MVLKKYCFGNFNNLNFSDFSASHALYANSLYKALLWIMKFLISDFYETLPMKFTIAFMVGDVLYLVKQWGLCICYC